MHTISRVHQEDIIKRLPLQAVFFVVFGDLMTQN